LHVLRLRKGGVGKSTLTAHLAAFAHLAGRRCMVVDADPQGSLTLWHSMRTDNGLALQNAAQGLNRLVASALLNGYEWVFIDTAPTTWLVVQEAIRAATMVVMYGRPPLGKGSFGASASGSGAVMYPAFVCGTLTAGPEGVRGRVPIIPARCERDDLSECPDPGL
jgi:cellulose biosynthesis protein BcsQ